MPSYEYVTLFAECLEQPHLLVAGTTGSGKSTFLDNLLDAISLTRTPADTNYILIDPKKVELIQWSKSPFCAGYADTQTDAENILSSVCRLMDDRYKTMQRNGQRISSDRDLYVIVDELADLLLSTDRVIAKHIEIYLSRLAQLGRAAKIHLILATQQIRRATLPNSIIANIPARIGLRTIDALESKMIIYTKGCEELPLKGTCLAYLPSVGRPIPVSFTALPSDRLAVTQHYYLTTKTAV